MGLTYTLALGAEEHAVTISARRPALIINVDGREHEVSETGALFEQCVVLTVDGRSYQVWRTREGGRVHVRIGGRSFSVGYEDPVIAAHHHAASDDVLRADMPGVVVEVRGAVGSHVSRGDTLMVIESMKMQINVIAPRDGVIETLHVDVNQTFDKGDALVSLHEEN